MIKSYYIKPRTVIFEEYEVIKIQTSNNYGIRATKWNEWNLLSLGPTKAGQGLDIYTCEYEIYISRHNFNCANNFRNLWLNFLISHWNFTHYLLRAGNFDNKQQSQKRRIQSRGTHKTKQTTRQTVGHTFYEPTLNGGHLNRNKVVCVSTEIPLAGPLIRPTFHPMALNRALQLLCEYFSQIYLYNSFRCLLRDI